jgi:hypothetical protein
MSGPPREWQRGQCTVTHVMSSWNSPNANPFPLPYEYEPGEVRDEQGINHQRGVDDPAPLVADHAHEAWQTECNSK